MIVKDEIYFGDKNSFAIRYVPGYTDQGKYTYAYCHLILADQIIGDKEEPCLLNSWMRPLALLRDKINLNFQTFSNIEFKNRSDKEIFELLIKANQLEEEYDPQFLYLPVLKPEVWIDCCVRLDETIDAFIIFVIESEGEVKFLWQDWREPAQVLTLVKIFSLKIERSFVIKTIDTCLQKLEADLLKN